MAPRRRTTGRGVGNGAASAVFDAPHPGVHSPPGRRRGEWSRVTNGLIVFGVAVVVAIAIYSAAVASLVGQVNSWHVASGLNGLFTVEAPAGWHVAEATVDNGDQSQAYIMVIERSQWVRAYVAVYPKLAATARTWGATGARNQTLAQVHHISRHIWSDYFGAITSGPSARCIVNGRPAIWSRLHFTDDGRNYSGLEMSGVRMTLTHGSAGVLLAAVAPDQSWDEFKPIALHIINSIRIYDRVNRRPDAAPRRAPAR